MAKETTNAENGAVVKKTAEAVNTTTKAAGKEYSSNSEARDKATYTVGEFVKAADSVFGKHYSPDIIRAAMKVAGKETATKEEAIKIVSEFAHKEVSK